MKKLLLALIMVCTFTCGAELSVTIYKDPVAGVILAVAGDPFTVYVVEYSPDLESWYELYEVYGQTEIEVDPGFYRARIY